jgi:hypothetical protein
MKDNATIGMVLGGLNALLILAGFVLAILALFAIPRVGRDGILAPAICGLVINTILVGGMAVAILSLARVRAVAAARATAAARKAAAGVAGSGMTVDQAVNDAVRNHGGWLGFARPGGGLIAVTQIPDDTAYSIDFRGNFTADFSPVSVAVDNSAGSAELVVDPASLIIHYPDGHRVRALSSQTTFATAKSDAQMWVTKSAKVLQAPPGGKAPEGVACLPRGADLTDVTHISLQVNGNRIDVIGKFYSVAEKTELFERARSQQEPQQRQP